MNSLFTPKLIALLHSTIIFLSCGYEGLAQSNEGSPRNDQNRYSESVNILLETAHPIFNSVNNKTTEERNVHLTEHSIKIINSDSTHIHGTIEFLDYLSKSTNRKYGKARDKKDSVRKETFTGFVGANGIVLHTQHSSACEKYIRQIYSDGGLWSRVLLRFFERSRIGLERDTVADFSKKDSTTIRKLSIIVDTLILKAEPLGERFILMGKMMGRPIFSEEYGIAEAAFSLIYDNERHSILSGSITMTSKTIISASESLDVPQEVEGTVLMNNQKINFECR